jgi:ABC-type lipoprotein release transport system permease subunit
MITYRRVLFQSLRHHWRSHLGVILGAAVGSAALIGALVIGDSVRGTLRERAHARLGAALFAIDSGDRLFGAYLGQRMRAANASTLHLQGTAARQDGSARAREVHVYGSTPMFWSFSPESVENALRRARESAGNLPVTGPAVSVIAPETEREFFEQMRKRMRPAPGNVLVNEALAQQLQLEPGQTLILRFPKPSALSQDAVLSPRQDASAAMRVQVEGILDAQELGDFDLRAGSRPALNAFVNIDDLWRASGVTNRANLMLIGETMMARHGAPWRVKAFLWAWNNRNWIPEPVLRYLNRVLQPYRAPSPVEEEATRRVVVHHLQRNWRLSDAQVEVRVIQQPMTATGGEYVQPAIEVGSPRVFLDLPVARAAMTPRSNLLTNHTAVTGDSREDLAAATFVTHGLPIITYLANALRHGDRLTPYSMVTAAGPPWTPPDMADDEILVNEWLARDLDLQPGDDLELVYFDPNAGARLLERSNVFKVRAIVPLRGHHADRTLMPEFPGLAKAESTSDWDAGFPLAHEIRDVDETYWKEHRGTPKAFVTLHAGRAMWANRFGDYTALRFPIPENGFPSGFATIVERNLLANIDPADIGLGLLPVREMALKAATSGQDFGQLFLGFSFFLILAALLLMGLLFQFGLEQRLPEIGALLALGFRVKSVRRLWLAEGFVLACIGGVIGVAGGLLYAMALIRALTTMWRDAVAGAPLEFYATPRTLAIGLAAAVIVSALTIGLALRRQISRPARELLAGKLASARRSRSNHGWWIGTISALGAGGLVAWSMATGDTSNPGVFFGAGTLVLIAGMAAATAWLKRMEAGGGGERHDAGLETGAFTITSLGVRGTTRRRSRSLATIGLLACGTFLIAAIGVFRMDANREAWRRSSGTGGFGLIGEASLPISHDLNTAAGLEFYGLSTNDVPGVRFVPFRVHEGDDASCLNLNRAQRPRILGVNPLRLAERGAFTFNKVVDGLHVTNGWLALQHSESAAAPVPAIGDAASIQWALGRKMGDTLEMTDERGQPFQLRLVGGVANSILQGSLIIDEAAFTRLFPGESGYRFYLIDTPTNGVEATAQTLSRAMEDVGMEVTPATRRLAHFNAVQNTYLTTFQVLGGLGLLLGSAGLGIVVLRNVLERRGELALMTAIGFRRRLLARLVVLEHAALLALGLAIGVLAAAVAVLPSVIVPSADLPIGSLVVTLAGVVLLGLFTTWVATRASLRGGLLAALRAE